MILNLLCPKSDLQGYGRYGLKLSEALRAQGVDVNDALPKPGCDPDELLRRSQVTAWVATPTHARGWWSEQLPVISTMWETMRLPEAVRSTLHEFDTVIVPSSQNVELFSEYHDNVKRVPLGIDPSVWQFTPRLPADEFRFLIGGSGRRKGPDLAYTAFHKLWGQEGSWGSGPRPVLYMKNPNNEEFYGSRVRVVAGKIPTADEVALYAYCHVYLQPSRGEGFGLQPLQAIAQGMPTILTDAHGHADYAHLGIPLSAVPGEADYFMYGDAGQWWEPNLDELCDLMRHTYDHYDEACATTAVSAKEVAERWTWDHTATKFLDAIGRDRLTPYTGSESWHEVVCELFEVRVLSDMQLNVGGVSYMLHVGETYWEPADVKRCLFEMGNLHPDVTTGDAHGLAPRQVEALGYYQAKHSFCPTCSQQLGTQPRLADEMLRVLAQ